MNQYAEAINQRHRYAQYASRASTLLHSVLLFKKEGDNLHDTARIIGILGNGLVVLLPRYGVEGIVHVGDDEKEKVDESESTMVLKDERALRLLGEVRVRIRIDSAPERLDKVVYEFI